MSDRDTRNPPLTEHRLLRWTLMRLLRRYHAALISQGKIAPADAVLDLMDDVSGWCSPHRRLGS